MHLTIIANEKKYNFESLIEFFTNPYLERRIEKLMKEAKK